MCMFYLSVLTCLILENTKETIHQGREILPTTINYSLSLAGGLATSNSRYLSLAHTEARYPIGEFKSQEKKHAEKTSHAGPMEEHENKFKSGLARPFR